MDALFALFGLALILLGLFGLAGFWRLSAIAGLFIAARRNRTARREAEERARHDRAIERKIEEAIRIAIEAKDARKADAELIELWRKESRD